MEANQLQTKDLRVNNLLYFKNTKDIAMVSLIHEKHFDCRDEYGSFIPNGNYEPIPLSEDVLLRLGFEKGFYRYGFENYGLKCFKSLKENHWIVSQGFGVQFTELTEIQFVHELQNLIFALCGEELTFKK